MTEDEIRQAFRRLAMGMVNHPEVDELVQFIASMPAAGSHAPAVDLPALVKPADSVAQSRKRKP